MTRGLHRFHESGQTHFITFSCYRRQPFLTDDRACQFLTRRLEATRSGFLLRVYGYVWMPEHVHILMSEPERSGTTLADAIHFLKLSSSKLIRTHVNAAAAAFWQKRYYDRNIRNAREFQTKLRYIHRNPVKRGLCASPDEWAWSSFRHYAYGEMNVVEIESEWTARSRPPLTITHPG
jgi:putative transposase